MSTVVGLWVALKAGNFLNGRVTVGFSRGTTLHGVG
jgi:hypothetical protein